MSKQKRQDKPTDVPEERFRPVKDGKVKDTLTGYVDEPLTVDRADFPKDLRRNSF